MRYVTKINSHPENGLFVSDPGMLENSSGRDTETEDTRQDTEMGDTQQESAAVLNLSGFHSKILEKGSFCSIEQH